MKRPCPLLKRVEWLGANRVRLTFSKVRTKRVREIALPVSAAVAKKAHVVSCGLGLDFGNGIERSATYMYMLA